MTGVPDSNPVRASLGTPAVTDALGQLSDAQRETLHRYWVDRASGELTTALSFEFMLEDLEREGAPAALQRLAARCVEDEHRHTDYCVVWARRVVPDADAAARLVGTRPATFDGASAHDERILRTVFGCCFSETVATHILIASQKRVTLDAVHTLNQDHIKEEVHHARLGWALLAWPELGARDREMIARFVPELVRLTFQVWTSTPRPRDPALEALGFLSTELVQEGCREAFTEVILPGLAHHGVALDDAAQSEVMNVIRSASSASLASA